MSSAATGNTADDDAESSLNVTPLPQIASSTTTTSHRSVSRRSMRARKSIGATAPNVVVTNDYYLTDLGQKAAEYAARALRSEHDLFQLTSSTSANNNNTRRLRNASTAASRPETPDESTPSTSAEPTVSQLHRRRRRGSRKSMVESSTRRRRPGRPRKADDGDFEVSYESERFTNDDIDKCDSSTDSASSEELGATAAAAAAILVDKYEQQTEENEPAESDSDGSTRLAVNDEPMVVDDDTIAIEPSTSTIAVARQCNDGTTTSPDQQQPQVPSSIEESGTTTIDVYTSCASSDASTVGHRDDDDNNNIGVVIALPSSSTMINDDTHDWTTATKQETDDDKKTTMVVVGDPVTSDIEDRQQLVDVKGISSGSNWFIIFADMPILSLANIGVNQHDDKKLDNCQVDASSLNCFKSEVIMPPVIVSTNNATTSSSPSAFSNWPSVIATNQRSPSSQVVFIPRTTNVESVHHYHHHSGTVSAPAGRVEIAVVGSPEIFGSSQTVASSSTPLVVASGAGKLITIDSDDERLIERCDLYVPVKIAPLLPTSDAILPIAATSTTTTTSSESPTVSCNSIATSGLCLPTTMPPAESPTNGGGGGVTLSIHRSAGSPDSRRSSNESPNSAGNANSNNNHVDAAAAAAKRRGSFTIGICAPPKKRFMQSMHNEEHQGAGDSTSSGNIAISGVDYSHKHHELAMQHHLHRPDSADGLQPEPRNRLLTVPMINRSSIEQELYARMSAIDTTPPPLPSIIYSTGGHHQYRLPTSMDPAAMAPLDKPVPLPPYSTIQPRPAVGYASGGTWLPRQQQHLHIVPPRCATTTAVTATYNIPTRPSAPSTHHRPTPIVGGSLVAGIPNSNTGSAFAVNEAAISKLMMSTTSSSNSPHAPASLPIGNNNNEQRATSASSSAASMMLSTQDLDAYRRTQEMKSLPNGEEFQQALNKWEWATLDSLKMPVVFRGADKFVAVHIVQMRLLSKFPPNIPSDMMRRFTMVSHKMTLIEAWIFNTVNALLCKFEFGCQLFTTQDEVVKLADVERFYWSVKSLNLGRMIEHYRNEIRHSSNTHLSLTATVTQLKAQVEKDYQEVQRALSLLTGGGSITATSAAQHPQQQQQQQQQLRPQYIHALNGQLRPGATTTGGTVIGQQPLTPTQQHHQQQQQQQAQSFQQQQQQQQHQYAANYGTGGGGNAAVAAAAASLQHQVQAQVAHQAAAAAAAQQAQVVARSLLYPSQNQNLAYLPAGYPGSQQQQQQHAMMQQQHSLNNQQQSSAVHYATGPHHIYR